MPGDDGYRLHGTCRCADGGCRRTSCTRRAHPRAGPAAETGRRCWSSTRGCPANGRIHRSGSVLGRPSPETTLARHFGELMQRREVLPDVACPSTCSGAPTRTEPGWRTYWRGAEPAALRRPRHRGRRRCRSRRSCGAAPGRRPPADRVGPDVVEAAVAPTRRPAGLCIRR